MSGAPAPEAAFVERFDLPPTGRGPLDGLTFAVKDLIDVAGHVTGAGNPEWARTHAPATRHAPCVARLLAAGARCAGKTVTDELALSLLGENPHFGTPLNPRAPARVPGGSSSGSASAVASGLVDFALGTDTGGSVRVPAHNCGLAGWRPTHGAISLDGVVPLAPTWDTVGLFARSPALLAAAGGVLLGQAPVNAAPARIRVPHELLALADPPVRECVEPVLARLGRGGARVERVALRDLVGDATDLAEWAGLYRVIQRVEAWAAHGAWVEATRPAFGPAAQQAFALAKAADPALVPGARERFGELRARLRAALPAGELLCMPTAPCLAPFKGQPPDRDQPNGYFARTFALCAIGGVGGLPQVSLPAGTAEGVPVGLSLLAGAGQDAFLLGACVRLAEAALG